MGQSGSGLGLRSQGARFGARGRPGLVLCRRRLLLSPDLLLQGHQAGDQGVAIDPFLPDRELFRGVVERDQHLAGADLATDRQPRLDDPAADRGGHGMGGA